MNRTTIHTLVLLVAAMLVAAAVPAWAATEDDANSPASLGGTMASLELRASLRLVSDLGACPPGVAADACAPRTGNGSVSGLGRVSETYTWSFRMGPPTCPAGLGKPLATTGRLVVAEKGEIHFALTDGARCIEQEPLRNEPQDLRITGGTGTYAGASGSGTVERAVSAGFGTERWIGTLTVPGLEFDVTRPTIAGSANKVVRAKRGAKTARVVFRVTARDDRDGALATSCLPRSGSKFKLGRTRVSCSATDTSANTATAAFTVTVRKAR